MQGLHGNPRHEVVYTVHLVQGDQKDNVLITEDRVEAESFINHMLAINNLPEGSYYLLGREVVTKTHWLLTRHDPDGTVRTVK